MTTNASALNTNASQLPVQAVFVERHLQVFSVALTYYPAILPLYNILDGKMELDNLKEYSYTKDVFFSSEDMTCV